MPELQRGWGAVGLMPTRNTARPGRKAVEYRVGDEWLRVSAIAEDPRNRLRLTAKGVQSRIDRLKQSGRIPRMRGGRQGDRLPKATWDLTWRDFQRGPMR